MWTCMLPAATQPFVSERRLLRGGNPREVRGGFFLPHWRWWWRGFSTRRGSRGRGTRSGGRFGESARTKGNEMTQKKVLFFFLGFCFVYIKGALPLIPILQSTLRRTASHFHEIWFHLPYAPPRSTQRVCQTAKCLEPHQCSLRLFEIPLGPHACALTEPELNHYCEETVMKIVEQVWNRCGVGKEERGGREWLMCTWPRSNLGPK